MKTGALLLAAALLAVSAGCSVSREDDPETQRSSAIAACRGGVKEKLKAPATADFSGETATGTGPWQVTVLVDSENSFGSKVRTKWQCSVRLDGGYFRGNATLLDG